MMWMAVCSNAPQLQFTAGAIPHFHIVERNTSTPVLHSIEFDLSWSWKSISVARCLHLGHRCRVKAIKIAKLGLVTPTITTISCWIDNLQLI